MGKSGNSIVVHGDSTWTGLRLYKNSGEYALIETNSADDEIITLAYRDAKGNNQAAIGLPKRNGKILLVSDYGLGGNHLSGAGSPAKLLGNLPFTIWFLWICYPARYSCEYSRIW